MIYSQLWALEALEAIGERPRERMVKGDRLMADLNLFEYRVTWLSAGGKCVEYAEGLSEARALVIRIKDRGYRSVAIEYEHENQWNLLHTEGEI